jgi:CubicO group peptidase (beta-lactamase class C family)
LKHFGVDADEPLRDDARMSSTRRSFLRHAGLGVMGLALRPALGESPVASLMRSTPEAEGVSASAIGAFIDEMAATKHELHSFMMLRHGKVIAEGWWEPYASNLRHTMYSMSKSFTSTAVGFAVTEGKLKVDDKVIEFFPDDVPATVSENLAALTIKDLLTMSVGNEKEPTGVVVKSENWVRTFLAQNLSHKPGTEFMYNSAATYMCSAIVQKVTGQTVLEYLTPRLFEPLGVSGMAWETCPRGINTGGWGLSITTETMAKFGQLLLQKGQWNGKQILPAAWIAEATSFHIQQPTKKGSTRPKEEDDWQQGYGYQFWRCQHGAFRGDGAFGQFTIVLPEQDAVIIMTSETKDMQGSLDLVWKHLLPGMKAADKGSSSALIAHRMKQLLLPVPTDVGGANLIKAIGAKTFKMDKNDLGLAGLFFMGKDKDLEVSLVTASLERISLLHRAGKWSKAMTAAVPGAPPRLIAGGAPTKSQPVLVSCAYAVTAERTLTLRWQYVETPHHDTVTCVFDEKFEAVEITFVNSIAEMSGAKKDSRPVLKGKV